MVIHSHARTHAHTHTHTHTHTQNELKVVSGSAPILITVPVGAIATSGDFDMEFQTVDEFHDIDNTNIHSVVSGVPSGYEYLFGIHFLLSLNKSPNFVLRKGVLIDVDMTDDAFLHIDDYALLTYDRQKRVWTEAAESCTDTLSLFNRTTLTYSVKICHLSEYALFSGKRATVSAAPPARATVWWYGWWLWCAVVVSAFVALL